MFTENLDVFFNTADFATAALYDGDTMINVIFDRAYLDQLGIVAGRGPVALVQTAAVDADPAGNTLLVNGTTYTIVGFEPLDDGAIALLRLEA